MPTISPLAQTGPGDPSNAGPDVDLEGHEVPSLCPPPPCLADETPSTSQMRKQRLQKRKSVIPGHIVGP